MYLVLRTIEAVNPLFMRARVIKRFCILRTGRTLDFHLDVSPGHLASKHIRYYVLFCAEYPNL